MLMLQKFEFFFKKKKKEKHHVSGAIEKLDLRYVL